MSNIHATCKGGDGPDLSRYPNLVFAPQQWGADVVCCSNGTRAIDVVKASLRFPVGASMRELADDLGISLGEAIDALRYVADQQ